MAADPVAFTMPSDQGAAVEGRVLVRWVGWTSRGRIPGALVCAPIESMLTAAGDAWAEFEHVEGDGYVFVLVVPEEMDRAASAVATCAVETAGNGTVACGMYYGGVWVNGALVRDSTPDWGAYMAPGESVRVRYVAATRMVSVVWRGRAYDLAALPATADIAHMRFGVALGRFNSMRVTGASATHFLEPHVRFVVRTRVLCQAGQARANGVRGDIVAWLCERAPLWVVVHVCTLLRAY